MFKNNLKHLQIHKDERDMKIRTCFIMKFVYSHNVIIYWNNMKPLLLMLHFTPAVNSTTVTREKKTCRCPWRHFAHAQFTLWRSAIERICFLKCEWWRWTEVLFITLCLLPSCSTFIFHQWNSSVRALAVQVTCFLTDSRCHYAVHDCNITVQENLYEWKVNNSMQ